MDTLHRWSDQEFLYQYVFKAPVLSERDMVYYEGYFTDEAGVVTNVSVSTPEFDASVPLPSGRVRSKLLLHFKRYKPVPEGVEYSCIQQVRGGGKIKKRSRAHLFLLSD